jgi:hypothetical protein
MTEAGWNSCTNPQVMLDWLRSQGNLSDRKARLFAVACCRRIGALMPDEGLRSAVVTMERFADAQANSADRKSARRDAQVAQHTGRGVLANRVAAAVFALGGREVRWATPEAIRLAAEAGAASRTEWLSAEWRAALQVERAAQSRLLDDLLPFRTAPADPRWFAWSQNTPRRLAEAAYEERWLPEGRLDGCRLAVLADALAEAGCDNEEMLLHLRQQGVVHVRGCWVVDAVRGKS